MFNQDGICISCSLRFWKYFTCPQLSEKDFYQWSIESLCCLWVSTANRSVPAHAFFTKQRTTVTYFVRSYAYWHTFYHSIWGYMLWHLDIFVLKVQIKLELHKYVSHIWLEMHCTSQDLGWKRTREEFNWHEIMPALVIFFFLC